MQLVLSVSLWRKQGDIESRHIQDPKTKNAGKTNFLASTNMECPDEGGRNA